MLKKVALAALMATVAFASAEAATQTGTFTVSATFNPTCTIDTTLATFNFGNIGGTASTYRSNTPSQIRMTCSVGTPYSVTLASTNTSGGPVATGFNMSNSGQLMSYRLYPGLFTNPAWDVGGASTSANGSGTGSLQGIDVYGEIPSQTPAGGVWNTGSFSDTVTATITY